MTGQMTRTGRKTWTSIGAAAIVAFTTATSHAAPITFEAAGANAASIQATVDNFRSSLGALNPNNGSSFTSGRREINWDGAPDASADPNPFPGEFFSSTTIAGRARGASFTTPGTGFLVSANAGLATPTTFGYPSDFIPFSAQRLFAPIGSTITDIFFFVPGTLTAASVSGFGAVFNDVEFSGSTRLEAFGLNNSLLYSRDVMVGGNGSLSFLGVLFNAGERIGRIRLTTGDAPLLGNGSYGSGFDGVVMDDFIYGEPQGRSVPEPATCLLLGASLVGFAVRARRRSASS